MMRLLIARPAAPAVLTLALLALHGATAAAQQAEQPVDSVRYHLPEVRIEVARLAVGGIPLARAPFAAQVVSGVVAQRASTLTIADALQRLPGVASMDALGTPFQPSLFLRGFSLSPIVGLPQGLSVFVDGVRVNEPDASQVNFDLIPIGSVERIEVLRGPSGPFGKNTLAGAINIVTRRGEPGAAAGAEVRAGGFGGVQGQGFVSGGQGPFDFLLSGRYLRTDGWREAAFTRLGQVFAKTGWRSERTDGFVSYTFARDSILQAGSLPESWLQDPLSVPQRFRRGNSDPRTINFTGGDYFGPTLHFLNGSLVHRLTPRLSVESTLFLRRTDVAQFNANFTEPDTRLATANRSTGGTAQLAYATGALQLTSGVEYTLNDVGIRIFAHPNQNHPGLPASGALNEDVGTREHNFAAFAQARVTPSRRVGLTGSLRYDYVDLPFRDVLEPDNDGDNLFRQLTGSAGIDYVTAPGVVLFAGYGRGFRAPVLMELACADPDDPCPLPFELGADPPLDPVTTDTWQGGARVYRDTRLSVEAVGYWAEVYNEIFSVQPPGARVGYFQNLERTRRQGVELSFSTGSDGPLRVFGNAAYTRATFQTTAVLAAPYLEGDDEDAPAERDEDPDDDALEPPRVEPGHRLPLIPALSAALGMEYSLGGWSLGAELSHVGSRRMRGDEDNEDDPLDPYTLFGLSLERSFGPLVLFAEVDNLLDARYETFGVLTQNRLNDPDEPHLEPFLTPGMPRRLLAGARYRW